MHRISLVFCFLMICFSSCKKGLFSQNVTLKGQVIDSETLQPIANFPLTLYATWNDEGGNDYNRTISTITTDSQGNYEVVQKMSSNPNGGGSDSYYIATTDSTYTYAYTTTRYYTDGMPDYYLENLTVTRYAYVKVSKSASSLKTCSTVSEISIRNARNAQVCKADTANAKFAFAVLRVKGKNGSFIADNDTVTGTWSVGDTTEYVLP